jgi:nucleoside-diphosphate-sugar epimerase
VDERFLITGSEGCIGAWVLRQLVAEGVPCVAYDLVAEGRRLRQIAGDEVADSIISSVIVLPAPLGPRIPNVSPRATANDTPSTA